MDFNKDDFYGYFDGAEGDDKKYVWLQNTETGKHYILPTDEETAISINEEYEEFFKDADMPVGFKLFGYSMIVSGCLMLGHIIMSETEGYEKVGNWIKQKSQKVKSKFKKKAE